MKHFLMKIFSLDTLYNYSYLYFRELKGLGLYEKINTREIAY